ncbi:Rossmann-fold NAD(P)-binding domain-containing protein [Roseimarinus sediminis]|uniref:NAD-dependent epimerase/dehydratase family protein n=1 Tax=Roseimarinus sediminis TaxID=1610899 RepID=UPI003D1AA313
MQTILGSGGSIGAELARVLPQYTSKIRLVSRNPKKINQNDELLAVDLSKRNNIFNAIKGSKIVYVTIGFPYRTKEWERLWPAFIHHVINACIFYHAKLVFLDNMYLYSPESYSCMTEDALINPPSEKGKIRAQVACKLSNQFTNPKIDLLIARAPDFIGCNNSIFNALIYDRLKKGKKANWLINPKAVHNGIAPVDAAKALAILANDPSAYKQIWHLPSLHEKLNGEEWTQLFAQHLHVSPRFKLITKSMLKIGTYLKPILKELYDIRHQYEVDYFFDSTKFEKHYNYQALSAEQLIKSMIEKE